MIALFWLVAATGLVWAQGFEPEPVFNVRLLADREPLVAGEQVRLAVVVTVDRGWHINSDQPGDEFSVPTTVAWKLPDGWPEPEVAYPNGRELKFEFADAPIEVWEGKVVIFATARAPEAAEGSVILRAEVTAQACNDRQCLPPLAVTARAETRVAAIGSAFEATHTDVFDASVAATSQRRKGGSADDTAGLAGLSLPVLLLTVFLGGLGLNLTPCVYPLIPITVGFFAQQGKDRVGGTFSLALVYVLGMSVTYSALGVAAALGGKIFGAALQSPFVIGVIVAVVLALAASMFGLWELRVPGWAMRASGGRTGLLGALIMGLVVGFVAAPCIGPFVIGLLTFVGQRGDPILGFTVFFTLAMGLGLPFLLLGTFTGSLQKLPTAGQWMVGIRMVFGVLLLALAAYFAAPLLPEGVGMLAMAAILVLGGLYLLVVARTGHDQPAIDRAMRLVCLIMVVVGLAYLPGVTGLARPGEGPSRQHLEWHGFEMAAVEAAVASGQPVVIDFYADWCAPCRELDERTFADPRVAEKLDGFARFKADQTRGGDEAQEAATRFGVMGVPTVIVFEAGKEKFRITGFEPPERFLKRLFNGPS